MVEKAVVMQGKAEAGLCLGEGGVVVAAKVADEKLQYHMENLEMDNKENKRLHGREEEVGLTGVQYHVLEEDFGEVFL